MQRPAFASTNSDLDFESGNFLGWNTERLLAPYSGQVIKDFASSGVYSARFELRPNDFNHNGFRAEIKEPFNATKNSLTTYSFSTFVPEDAAFTVDNRCIFAQWHDQDMDIGEPTHIHSPPLSLSLEKNKLTVKQCLSNEQGRCKKQILGQIANFEFGRWHDFVVNIRWSAQADGFVQMWLDKQQIVSYSGRTSNPAYSNYFDNIGPYMKLGIYCGKNPTTTLVLYHDHYSRLSQ